MTVPGKKLRVLIVDDAPAFAQLLRDIVEGFDCQSRVVHGIDDALTLIPKWQPHLLLMDQHMPSSKWPIPNDLQPMYDETQKSFALCHAITRNPTLSQHMSIAFVSADDQPASVQMAIDAGALAYIVKPLVDDSLERLKKVIQIVQGTALREL